MGVFLNFLVIVFVGFFGSFCQGVYENNPFLNNNSNNSVAVVSSLPPILVTTTSFPSNPTTQSSTRLPNFTIEPPNILYGDLRKKCLQPRGIFPSYTCDKFVNCWDGNAVEQSCSSPLLFNPKGYCDYPENVNCNSQNAQPAKDINNNYYYINNNSNNPALLPDVSKNTDNLRLRSKCLKPKGQFATDSCQKYVDCWDDVATERDCPDGLLFNSEKGYCDFSYNVKCQGREQQPIEKTSECLLENGVFRDRNNCSLYHKCINGKIIASFVCPEGFSFSDNLGVCDYANRVDCSKPPQAIPFKNIVVKKNRESNIIETIIPPPVVDDKINTACPIEYGMFRDSKNCAIYYLCAEHKVAAKYECPNGFKFNDNIGVCDYEFRVDCSEIPKIYRFKNNENNIHVPKELMKTIEKCMPGAVFALDSKCTMACKCRVGLAEIINCPEGLGYDSKIDKCVPLLMARC